MARYADADRGLFDALGSLIRKQELSASRRLHATSHLKGKLAVEVRQKIEQNALHASTEKSLAVFPEILCH
jgi:hypothetical protein